MKIGTEPAADPQRVRAAREAIGPAAELFVDANGAYARKQALALAERFAELGVTWFEEPVSSDDLEGLRLIRDRCPGRHGSRCRRVRLRARVLPPHAGGRCRRRAAGGCHALRRRDRLPACRGALRSRGLPLSAHCGPSEHLHVCCAVPNFRHLEYFHDHVRIEHLLFDGAPVPQGGCLRPDLSRPGMGLDLREDDAARFLIWHAEASG